MDFYLQGSGDMACAAAKPNCISLEFYGLLMHALSGIWREFDVVCLLLEGRAHLFESGLLQGHLLYELGMEVNNNEGGWGTGN